MKNQNTETKEIKGIKQGVYDTSNIELLPKESNRERKFKEVLEAIKAGKCFVLREGYTQNSVYVLMRKLKTAGFEVIWNKTKNNGVVQFVIMRKPEKKD